MFIPQSVKIMRAASNEPAIAPYFVIVAQTWGVNPSSIPNHFRKGQNPNFKYFPF
jgi:hypothetical protein